MKKIKVYDLNNNIPSGTYVFICCASFEKRCTTIANNIDKDLVKKALISKYDQTDEITNQNLTWLKNYFADKSLEISLGYEKPLDTANNLFNSLVEAEKVQADNILVDITTFTHESLLILFKLLNIRKTQKQKIFFAYSNAAEYDPGEKDESKWLSFGVKNIRTVLGYPGEILPSKKSHLIILVGYESERAAELIRNFEPDILTLGHGKSGTQTAEQHHKTNQHFFGLVKQAVATHPEVNTFEFSCNDPLATRDTIAKLIKENSQDNIIIAPMNTKLSTIGAGLVSLAHTKVQVCYCQPLQYNQRNYSSPGEDCYIVEYNELFG